MTISTYVPKSTKIISLNTNSNIHHKLSWLVSQRKALLQGCADPKCDSVILNNGYWFIFHSKAFHAPFYARPVTPLNLLHFFCPTAFSILRTSFPPMISYQSLICLSFTPSNFHTAHLVWKCIRFTFHLSHDCFVYSVCLRKTRGR